MKGKHEFFGICPIGFEAVAAAELEELSAHDIRPDHGGVHFAGSLELMFRVNLRARCLTRVLLRLASFKALSFPELYNKSRKSFWSRYIGPVSGIAVHASCHGSRLMHSGRVEQTIAAAISDLGLADAGGAPGYVARKATQSIYARFENDLCTLSLDSSGERLDRRGYRQLPGAAPLRETMAAGLLRWMAWHPDEILMVPMCGSGTIAIEAALIGMRQAPNRERAFPFEGWPCLQQKHWQAAKEKTAGMARPLQASIYASDLDAGILELARANAASAGADGIVFTQADIRSLEPVGENGLIILNPPYGGRIGGVDANRLYGQIGRRLQSHFGGWRKLVITPDADCERQLGGRVRRRLPFLHGGLHVQALDLE